MWLVATVLNITELVSLGGKHHEKNRIFSDAERSAMYSEVSATARCTRQI